MARLYNSRTPEPPHSPTQSMGFFKRLFGSFGSDSSSSDAGDDPLGDLTLDRLREGYLVDYDLKTWTVETHARYDYEGFPADEWTLRTDSGEGSETLFLSYEDDDEAVFVLSRPVDLTDLRVEGDEAPLRQYVSHHGEPPAALTHEGDAYKLEETGPAERIVDDHRQSLRYWDFAGAEGRIVSLERFGESDWNAYAGREVAPYEFDNILPRSS